MRGSKAKKIREVVYGKGRTALAKPAGRKYYTLTRTVTKRDGKRVRADQVIADKHRRTYQRLKKAIA